MVGSSRRGGLAPDALEKVKGNDGLGSVGNGNGILGGFLTGLPFLSHLVPPYNVLPAGLIVCARGSCSPLGHARIDGVRQNPVNLFRVQGRALGDG